MTSEGVAQQTKVLARQLGDLEVTIMLRWPETHERVVDGDLTFPMEWCVTLLMKYWGASYALLMDGSPTLGLLLDQMDEFADRVNVICRDYMKRISGRSRDEDASLDG